MCSNVKYVDFFWECGTIFFTGYYGDFMKEMLKKYWSEFKTGTKTMFAEFSNKETNKKQRANMWTFTRLITPIITVILSIIAIITASVPLFITTACIAGFGALTDKFDGASARKHESFSEYGKVLDQITDKSFAGIIGINLLFLNPTYIFVLLGEGLIALVNILYKLKHKNLNINSTFIGKVKQTPLFISLALGYLSTINPILFTISNYSIILATAFQLTTAASYIKSNSEALKEMKKNEKIRLTEEIEDLEETKDKTNEKEITPIQLTENKTISRMEQCENLRKLRDELTATEDSKTIGKEGYQKTKK